MRNRPLILFVSLFMMSVPLRAQGTAKDITIPMKSDRLDVRSFVLSEMVESVKYIRIDDSSTLGNIIDIKFWDGCFYLQDSSHQTIAVVNGDGKIVSIISHRGRASNEYISLQAYAIGKTDGSVYIFDNSGMKIVVYSKTGAFIRSIPLSEDLAAFRDIEITPRGTVLLYNPLWIENIFDALVELDASGKKLRTLFENDKKHQLAIAHVPSDYFSVMSDGSITLMGREDRDLFYRLSPDGKFTSSYHMATDVTIPSELKKKVNLTSEEMKAENYYQKMFYQETDNWLCFALRYQRKTKYCFYNKKKEKQYVIKSTKDIQDPFETQLTRYKRGSGPYLLSVLSNPGSDAYKRAVSEVPPGDNPIIVIAKTR